MPDVTALATTLRKGQFQYTGHLVTPPRTIVLEGTITATATYSALQVTYTTTAGSAANVTQDMTVVFTSSTGVLKAVLRVASGQSITSTVLPLNEFSRSLYEVTIGDKFKVYAEYRIWDRLVAASATLNKDSRIAYTSQLADPVPVCNSGGPYAGFGATVNFTGDTSFTTDPDSFGTLTHAWDFIDGTPSTSSSANPTGVVFPVGFRLVKHTVTDTGNSKSTVQYVEVWVVDKTTYRPLRVQMDSLNEPKANPTRISFKLPYGSEGDIATLPDGAPIVYFEKEIRKGVEGSYGSNIANRSHIKFSGYLVRDSISIDADQNTVTFEAVNALGLLENTPALPQLMISNTAPTKWSEVRGLSTKEILWYLSYWGSTIQTSWDFAWTDGLNLTYARIATEATNIADQLRDIANGLNVMVTCDALGRIQFIRDPDFLTLTERNDRVISYNFTTADIIKIEISREHQGNTKFVEGQGITPGNAAVFAHAPGTAPSSFGTGSDTLAKQIVASQDDINNRTVLRWAQLNGIFNGRFVPKNVRMTVPDGYDVIQAANGELITLTLPASTNTRGIAFTNTERWTVASRDITYDSELGTKDIVYTIDHETYAAHSDDNTYTPPQEGDNGLPEAPPIDLTFPDTGFIPGTDTGVDPVPPTGSPTSPSTATMAVFSNANIASFTANFSKTEASGGPEWTTSAPLDLTGLSGWGGGDLIAFVVDDYSPSYLGTGDEVNGVLLTNEMVQRIEDIFGTPTLGSAFVFDTASTARTIALDNSTEGFGIVASWIATEGVYAAVTTDGGATWAESLVTAFENTAAGGIAPGVFISPHTIGKAYIAVWTATGNNTTATASLYKTTNSGGSWSHLTSPNVDTGVDVSSIIGVAFNNAPANVIYYRQKDDTGAITLRRNKNGTDADITPMIGELPYVPIGQRLHEIAIPDDDQNTLAMIGVTGAGGSADTWSIYTGTETDRTDNTITGNSAFGEGANRIGLSATGAVLHPADSLCRIVTIVVNTPGVDIGIVGWWLCGDDSEHIGSYTSACIWNIDFICSGPFSATFTLSSDDSCGDGSGVIDYAALISKNAYDETPTWAVIDHAEDFPYRQIFAIGAGKFLLIGLEGAVGVATATAINSRNGNLADTGEIVGSAGA